MSAPPAGPDVKACCAAAYDSDAVALLLGASYHPGGLALTRRLATTAGLRPGQRVLDVASGPGTTALLLATEFAASVVGVDLSDASLRKATAAAQAAGLGDRVLFHRGDAERLPFRAASFDAVVCECAFCTFPGKPDAASEFARVLRPGGRVGITDVTIAPGGLPGDLAGLAGWVACLADARPANAYAALLGGAGLTVTAVEEHDDALGRMVDQIDARLRVLRMSGGRNQALAGVDLERALELTGQAARAVAVGVAGYTMLVAEKPSCVPPQG
jgi:arsenite methyltransferase